ncbi:MAG: GAF domain-containing protein, partial [Dehalococcoidia bacterium]|nr:GAF domain-containing protein [Dehalococcoidia bacterium]
MPRTAVKKSQERFVGPDEQSAAGKVDLHNCVNLDEVLSSAVKLACDILKSDNASIALADEEGVLTLRTHRGVPPRFASRWRKRSSEGLSGIVFRTGQPYVAPDLGAEKHYVGK